MSSPTSTTTVLSHGNNLPQHYTKPGSTGFHVGNLGHIFGGFHIFGPMIHVLMIVVPVVVGIGLLVAFRFVYRLRRGPRYR
jgi:hypothetical protein